MGKKNKLMKFDDMAGYANVFQYCFEELQDGGFPLRGQWHSQYFHNDNPIVIELGCGKGEYTVGLAQRYPDKNFIGFDIKGARMWTGATQALDEGLSNVAFVRTRIELITHFFAPGEVSEIWITFADPQMKKVNKRLTCSLFMQRYLQILAPAGVVHLKTDSNFLFTYTEEMARVNALPVLTSTRDLYKDNDFASAEIVEALRGIRTYYESQWLARGIDIKYLAFRPESRDQWIEPEVEIELDSYRSFGRDKRSALNMHV
ncbi:MAG: tRNA (guanosine(46)-N7)-methyltransferase TrmB [Bacteroidales bacterium]|nr:tRNA (guanosine(46)-N7)-methyltransferase TrmB [Candidatus Liminaster caballi]